MHCHCEIDASVDGRTPIQESNNLWAPLGGVGLHGSFSRCHMENRLITSDCHVLPAGSMLVPRCISVFQFCKSHAPYPLATSRFCSQLHYSESARTKTWRATCSVDACCVTPHAASASQPVFLFDSASFPLVLFPLWGCKQAKGWCRHARWAVFDGWNASRLSATGLQHPSRMRHHVRWSGTWVSNFGCGDETPCSNYEQPSSICAIYGTYGVVGPRFAQAMWVTHKR